MAFEKHIKPLYIDGLCLKAQSQSIGKDIFTLNYILHALTTNTFCTKHLMSYLW